MNFLCKLLGCESVREVIKEVRVEVPVEVIKEVRVMVPLGGSMVAKPEKPVVSGEPFEMFNAVRRHYKLHEISANILTLADNPIATEFKNSLSAEFVGAYINVLDAMYEKYANILNRLPEEREVDFFVERNSLAELSASMQRISKLTKKDMLLYAINNNLPV